MTEAITFLSQPEAMPFTTALALMVLIGAISVIGLDFDVGADAPSIDVDVDIDSGVDASIDAGADSASGNAGLTMLDWFNPGRLPVLAAFALFLMIYSVVGLAGQQILESSIGMLPGWLAGLAALPAAYLVWQPASRIAGRIMPRDHTDAVSIKSLRGRRGIIEIGTATYEKSARAIVHDAFGTRHSLMVRMSLPDQEAHADDEVFLLEIGCDGEPSTAAPAEPRSILSI